MLLRASLLDYGADDKVLGGLNSFYLLVDKPEAYGLPSSPRLPSANASLSAGFGAIGAAALGLLGLLNFRKQRMDENADREFAELEAKIAAQREHDDEAYDDHE